MKPDESYSGSLKYCPLKCLTEYIQNPINSAAVIENSKELQLKNSELVYMASSVQKQDLHVNNTVTKSPSSSKRYASP